MPEIRNTPTGIMRYRALRPSPVVALAVHAGSELRPEVRALHKVDKAVYRYDEDPGTERFLTPFPVAAWALTSRFETDLNRPEAGAIYLGPETCWGIDLWREPPSPALLERTMRRYHEALALIDGLVDQALKHFGYCVLLDFHSYNYQRDGAVARWWEDGKPAVNLGTGGTHPRFLPLIDALADSLAQVCWQDRPLTVGENVVFKGGALHTRQQARYPGRVCVPSLEFKKIFMDERNGVFYEPAFSGLVSEVSQAIVDVQDRLHLLLPELTGEQVVRWR